MDRRQGGQEPAVSEPDPFKISEAVIDLWRCYIIERDMAKELQAENARLKAFSDEAQAHIAKEERKSRERLDMDQAENARLKAEVERLTKAGDAMASIIKYEPGVNTFDPVPDVVKRWQSAKEGKGQP